MALQLGDGIADVDGTIDIEGDIEGHPVPHTSLLVF